MMRRVLINLLENASKFTPPHGKIELGASLTAIGCRCGSRITARAFRLPIRTRIFDKFTRLEERGAPGGLGVGLAFCRLAVQGHGGKIWVESEAGTAPNSC